MDRQRLGRTRTDSDGLGTRRRATGGAAGEALVWRPRLSAGRPGPSSRRAFRAAGACTAEELCKRLQFACIISPGRAAFRRRARDRKRQPPQDAGGGPRRMQAPAVARPSLHPAGSERRPGPSSESCPVPTPSPGTGCDGVNGMPSAAARARLPMLRQRCGQRRIVDAAPRSNPASGRAAAGPRAAGNEAPVECSPRSQTTSPSSGPAESR